jgi:hypothetical protein
MMPAIAHTPRGWIAVLFALCFILTGCGKTKVTKENFEKISNGMTLEEVEGVLGEGTQVGGDGSLVAAQAGVDVNAGARPSSTVQYNWESGKNSITVYFRQGKVVLKKSSGL